MARKKEEVLLVQGPRVALYLPIIAIGLGVKGVRRITFGELPGHISELGLEYRLIVIIYRKANDRLRVELRNVRERWSQAFICVAVSSFEGKSEAEVEKWGVNLCLRIPKPKGIFSREKELAGEIREAFEKRKKKGEGR